MVPDYQKMMSAILKLAADGKEHSLSELAEAAAKHFHLDQASRDELLPSGGQSKLMNRVTLGLPRSTKTGDTAWATEKNARYRYPPM